MNADSVSGDGKQQRDDTYISKQRYRMGNTGWQNKCSAVSLQDTVMSFVDLRACICYCSGLLLQNVQSS
jgi:hypothetical protein